MRRLLAVLWILLIATALPATARTVRVKLHKGKVITLKLEDYVAGVMMGEASTFTSAEARKAMAIAVRTFAVRHLGRHSAEGYDFCETTHCQDFRTTDGVSEAVRTAVEATDSELLWYDGRPAATHYTGHCGGQSAAGREIWPDLQQTAPYLRSAPDTFCLTRGRADWSRQLPPGGGPLTILRRSASGRVLEVLLNGRRQSGELFPSNLFESAGPRIAGHGAGHGVGLCQVGAEERGKAGQTHEEILKAYYPGTVLGIAAGGLRWRSARGDGVEVFASSEATLREVLPLAERAMRDAIRTLPLPTRPPTARIRVYPTIAVYRDATGDSGHIAATTSGSLVRLQPPGVLRGQGVLYSTLRHEMLHVLIETSAAPSLPAWFREDLARRPSYWTTRHGLEAVMGWLRSGQLPRDAVPPVGAR